MFICGNHGAGGENSSSWWGCLCDVCFTSKKSSEQEFFVPTRMHVAINSLTATDGRDHPLFNELLR